MKRHIENTRASLTDLHSLSATTEAAERRILGQARARLDDVNAMLERQRPGVEGAPDAAQDRYLSLVQERGQLHIVIAKAKAALGE
jgi:hypothetical protein